MGNGFTKLLEATGKLKLIASDEIWKYLGKSAKLNIKVKKLDFSLPNGNEWVVIIKGENGDEHSYYRTEENANDAAERYRSAEQYRESEVGTVGLKNSAERVRSARGYLEGELGLAAKRVVSRRSTESHRILSNRL